MCVLLYQVDLAHLKEGSQLALTLQEDDANLECADNQIEMFFAAPKNAKLKLHYVASSAGE